MTVLETIDLARNMLNEPLDASRTFPDNSSNFYTDTVLLNYLNREQQLLQNFIIQSHENYFVTSVNVNIVSNTDEYALNSSVIKILRMEWIADDPLRSTEIHPISFNEKENYIGLSHGITGTGEIRAYAIKGDTLTFRPVPSTTTASAVRYYFVKKLADLVSQSQVSEVPENYHEILSWGIYKRALLQQEGSAESYAVASKEYESMVEEMMKQLDDRQIQRPRYVKRNRNRRN